MKLRDIPKDMIDRASAIGHQTVWLKGSKVDEPGDVFIFITWNNDTAIKAKTALKAADALCDTDLGPIPEDPSNFLSRLIDKLYKLFNYKRCKDCGVKLHLKKLAENRA